MNDDDAVRELFVAYARLAVPSTELQEAIGTRWSYRHRAFELPPLPAVDPPIGVSGEEVAAAMAGVVRGSRSSEELEEWANMIIMSDVYEVVGERRDAVLQVLHDLASPGLFGGLTRDRLRDLLRQLNTGK